MAAYIEISKPIEEYTAADILALAAQVKRRKLSPTEKVIFLDGDKGVLTTRIQLRNFKRTIIPPVERPVKKTPMRGARKGKH